MSLGLGPKAQTTFCFVEFLISCPNSFALFCGLLGLELDSVLAFHFSLWNLCTHDVYYCTPIKIKINIFLLLLVVFFFFFFFFNLSTFNVLSV